MKERINVTIDEDLMKKVRDGGFNISGEIESALRKRLGGMETVIPAEDGEKCSKCGKAEQKASRDNLVGLTWLCPDEVWICSDCLDVEIRQVVVSSGIVPVMSKEKRLEVMSLAREFVNEPEIKKDILTQLKHKITGYPT